MPDNPEYKSDRHIPFEHEAAILHGPANEEERKNAERQARDEEYKRRDDAFKERQVSIAERQLTENARISKFTLALVIVSLIGAGVSIYQARIASISANAALRAAQNAEDALTETRLGREHASREAQHARELSAAQTHDAMEASTQENMATLDTNIEASRNDQRAWISILDLKLAKEPFVNTEAKATFTILNTGKTPAVKVSVITSISIQSIETEVPDWSKLGREVNGIVFPGGTIKDVAIILPADKVSEYAMLSYNPLFYVPNMIYIRIRVEYEDVFGRPHWTQACGKHPPATPLDRWDQCLLGIGVDPPTEIHTQKRPQ